MIILKKIMRNMWEARVMLFASKSRLQDSIIITIWRVFASNTLSTPWRTYPVDRDISVEFKITLAYDEGT